MPTSYSIYHKKSYERNKQAISESRKLYYQRNKVAILAKKKQKYAERKVIEQPPPASSVVSEQPTI